MAKRPQDTIRDGRIRATIWRNEGERGPYLSTDLTRSYQDQEGNWKESRSFSLSDLLKVAEVSRTAYTRGREIELSMRDEREQWREEERERAQAIRDQELENEIAAEEEALNEQAQLEAERAQFLEERAAESRIEQAPAPAINQTDPDQAEATEVEPTPQPLTEPDYGPDPSPNAEEFLADRQETISPAPSNEPEM